MKFFPKNSVGVFNVASKPFPFREDIIRIDGADYKKISSSLSKGTFRSYIVDDAGYLMTFASFAKVNEVGYQKFTQFALDFYNLLQYVINGTSPDTIVYFNMHIERGEDGYIKAKTIGKMLDNQLCLEGLFAIVLMCVADCGRHYFVTQSDGMTTAKSPEDMFDINIDNNLYDVDTKIREYWGLKPLVDGKKGKANDGT